MCPAAGCATARIRDSFHFDGLDGLRERSPAPFAAAPSSPSRGVGRLWSESRNEPPRVTNVDPLGSARGALPRVPRSCSAVQGRLAFTSRYVPLDSVLTERWADRVRPEASPLAESGQRATAAEGVNLPVA